MATSNPTYEREHGGEWFYKWDLPNGKQWRERWRSGSGGGTAQEWLNIRTTDLDNVVLPGVEAQDQLEQAAIGNNPDKVPPDHQTQEDFDRRLIGLLMAESSVDTLIAAIPFWTAQESRNGNNNIQRAASLGVPTAEYVEADGRFGDLQGVAGGVNNVNEQVWEDVKGAWL